MGTTGGGVWVTRDGGIYWRNITDGFFKRASVGALAVSQSDPNVIYAGMGETTIRGNVSHGDGVYKSDDGGQTWRHMGLATTRNIGKVRVHPTNPDIVYVAAFGHAHGPNPERGLYRSLDGGESWKLVLYRSEDAGAVDISIDPNNSRHLFASFWEARRGPYSLSSGGPGSGLFQSTDGGDTWEELTRKPGMPEGLIGKIGVAVSPAQRGRVWAIVENEDGGLFRSDDSGQSWEHLSKDRSLRQRAWYYSHVIADPADANTVYVLNVMMQRSVDGGKTFEVVPVPHGDTHDLWIDPADPKRMILGDDGGGTVTYNGAGTWTPQYSQPTSEMYHVSTDSRRPFRVYGSQQDNTSMSVPSRSNYPFITRTEWHEVGGGEAGYIAVRPDNPNIVYAGEYMGYMTRYDHSTEQARNISVWPEDYSGSGGKDYRYRFQWTYPIIISPHDVNTIYCGGNHVFRSRSEGHSWEIISPDLTCNDPITQQPSGGPITKDNTGAETYGTVFTLAESPLRKGLLWAGSDDGLIHLTRDGGKKWVNVTPPDLPPRALISMIEASPHEAAVAYFAANRYKHDDFSPYLFTTSNFGKTWQRIDHGIRDDDFTRTIREDPAQRGLLYAGSETGIYLSRDDGVTWSNLGGNLPVVPVHDFVITDDCLAVATHGRAFWIHDDLSLVRQLAVLQEPGAPVLLKPRDTVRYGSMPSWSWDAKPGRNYQFAATQVPAFELEKLPDDETRRINLDSGTNPPDGVVINYVLPGEFEGDLTLTFLKNDGTELRSVKPKPRGDAAGQHEEQVFPPPLEIDPTRKDEEPHLLKKSGLNRFVWDFRGAPAERIATKGGDQPKRTGPRVAPGKYRVRLQAGDVTSEQTFEILPDPRLSTTAKEYASQHDLLLKIRNKHDDLNHAVNQIRTMRDEAITLARQIEDRKGGKPVVALLHAYCARIDVIEGALLQRKIESEQDSLNYSIKLNAKLSALAGMVEGSEDAPTTQAAALYNHLAEQVDRQLADLAQVTNKELTKLNDAFRKLNSPAISVPPGKADSKKTATQAKR